MKAFIVKILASGLGTGYVPVASGTWGTALAALIYWYFIPDTGWYAAAAAAATTLVSVPVSFAAEALYGKKDDSRIVIDEVAGYFVSIAFLPKTTLVLVSSFFLFRLFDVIKPFFVKKVQVWRGGYGIVADDVFAGMLANIVVQVVVRIVR